MKKFNKLKLIVKDPDSNKDFETTLIVGYPYMIVNVEKALRLLHNTEKISFTCVDETKLKPNELDLPTLSNFVVQRVHIINSLVNEHKVHDKKELCRFIVEKYLWLLRDTSELSSYYLKKDVSYKLFDETIMTTIRTQISYTIRNFVDNETMCLFCDFMVAKLVEAHKHKNKKNLDIYNCFEDPIRNYQEYVNMLKSDINRKH